MEPVKELSPRRKPVIVVSVSLILSETVENVTGYSFGKAI